MPKSLPKVLDDDLLQRIAKSEDAEAWLILGQHPDFPGYWVVNCLKPSYIFDFEDLIGGYRALSPARLEEFLERAEECSYEVAFEEAPTEILDHFSGLDDPPEISLDSDLPGTINGLLPFQVRGFNYLKDLDAGIAMWSSGTGKTALACALLKYHMSLSDYDIAFVVVKGHNKINTQRTLLRLAGIESIMLDGPQKNRQEIEVNLREAPCGTIVVTNYEKFRIDQHELKPLFEKRILMIYDEMPTKLKSRKTQLYKSIRGLLYKKADLSEKRPKTLRQYMLSATPIENDPEDFFNCSRLLSPDLYGSIKQFRDEYVRSYNYFGSQPAAWQHLDRMGLKASHIMHQVDKSSPEIASQFPQVLETEYIIDWAKPDRVIYEMFTERAKASLNQTDVLGLITVLQMMCNAPSTVSASAQVRDAYESQMQAFSEDFWWHGPPPTKKGSEVARKLQMLLTRDLTDETHTKLETLKQLLTEDHPNEKVVIFSAYNEAILPTLENHLLAWSVPFVRYEGTQEQKQRAQDYFQRDPLVRVFLSSDQGSDSISLEEASVVIHYDLPWKMSTLIQRQNRAHRVTSKHPHVRFYRLIMHDSIEERKAKILSKKWSYHNQVFQEVKDQSESSALTREELLYILTGEFTA